jgi:uncharacterized caspase-like protein
MKLLPPTVRPVAVLAGLLLLMGGVLAAGEQRGKAKKLLVEGTNENPGWLVRVDVDRPDRTYKEGSEVVITVRSEKPGYLYVFDVGPTGEVTCLFPNANQQNNQIEGDKDVVIPGGADKDKFKISVGTPLGKEFIKAFVTTKPLESLNMAAIKSLGKGKFLPMTEKDIKKLVYEAEGAPESNSSGSVQADRDKFRQEKPDAYLDKSQQWSEHDLEITTVPADKPQPVQQSRRVAVCVGISEYKDQNIHALHCAHTDAQAMAKALKQYCGVQEVHLLQNSEATLANIRQKITDEVVNGTKPGDTVFLYWSGHGGTCASTTAGRASDEFLVPHDGLYKEDDPKVLRSSMLMHDMFGRWVQALDGRNVVVILDTCHSGGQIEDQTKALKAKGSTKDLKGADNVARYGKAIRTKNDQAGPDHKNFLEGNLARMKGIGQKDAIVLASSTAKQVSFERTDGKMSVMTYFLIEALNKLPAKSDMNAVFAYVKEKVPSYTENEFAGTKQNPVLSPSPAPATPPLEP